MPREPTDIVEPKLRIRESLRAKLEVEAARQQTSLNAEMVRRLEDSFDDKPRANLATATRDFATSAQDLRQIATRIETGWERLEATQTLLLLTDLLTAKVLDHNIRDASGTEIPTHAWVDFHQNLVAYAKDLRRMRASVDQRRRDEWEPRS